MSNPGFIKNIQNDLYYTSYLTNSTITLIPVNQFTELEDESYNKFDYEYYSKNITVTTPKNEQISIDGTTGGTFTFNSGGTYKIQYSGTNRYYSNNIVTGNKVPTDSDYSFYYVISAVENHRPLKEWTITDVLNRLFDVCEPIRKGEKPRFRLQGVKADGTYEPNSQADRFDKILAPQFSFTKQTLRECLKDVGGVIHGEPRITPKKDDSGWYFEVSYDMYASQEESNAYTLPYILKNVSMNIERYATEIDSHAENLINELDKYSGVIVEPYSGGAKTVRTENMYVRITEDNMIIPTQYPIYSVEKLEYVYLDDGTLTSVDITPWLFEKSVYDSQLASYKEQYPYSKAYGIYYSQGNKNIGGLNFKMDGAVLPEFNNYAILNILRQATGNEKLEVSYPSLCFRVTYTPFYNARIGQTKSFLSEDFKRPAALIYNQGANVIESRYYGENLKGEIARIGNVEASITFILASLKSIPKAGQMYNKDYYISSVAVTMYPTCFACTIGLSKDFNRLSQYIGINSAKRYSEISQGQSVERNTLWKEYIVIGKFETPDSACLIGAKMLAAIAGTFTQDKGAPLTNVCAWGTTYKGSDIATPVNLPVISSAFGNSISFSWQYEDNYSAGAASEYVSNAFNGSDKSAYFQNNVPYTDYYGRIYYYHFDLQESGKEPNGITLESIGRRLPRETDIPETPSGYISTVAPFSGARQSPYILRKDNREALQCNFQIDFVSNLENLIIGSALASYCPAIRGTDASLKAKLYIFGTELSKFTDHIESYENVKLKDLPSMEIFIEEHYDYGYFIIYTNETFPVYGASWAIVTAQTEEEGEDVEDEFGNVSPKKIIKGGDLLIGQNISFKKGDTFTPIQFTAKREIFDKTVWKDVR